jgi:hypothetical protein
VGFCNRLRISPEECQRQVHAAVETIKKGFGPDNQGSSHIAIYGRPTKQMTNVKPESISFSKNEVEGWHAVWAEGTEKLLDNIIATVPRCRRAVFAGGVLQNRYLRHRLQAKLKRHDIMLCDASVKYPCSRGALLHYLFEADESIRNATFFTTLCEEYDQNVNTDVAALSKSGSVVAHTTAYKWDKSQRVVYDRLVLIMHIVDHEEMISNPIAMNFHIDSSNPGRLHFDVYCTQSDRHRLHGPLMDVSGNVFPDMVPYPIAFVDLPRLYGSPLHFQRISVSEIEKNGTARRSKKPKKRKSPAHGKGYYEVLGLVEMHKSNGSYEPVLRLFNRDYEWQYDNNGMVSTFTQDMIQPSQC